MDASQDNDSLYGLKRRRSVLTFGHHAELLIEDFVLSPEETHLTGQLTLLLVTVDEDVGGC